MTPNSSADWSGLKVGDEIVTLAGQPLLSIADLQWVLHMAPTATKLPANVRRSGKMLDLMIDLPEGWRRGNISWRVTTWDLRRMGFGGLFLEELTREQREGVKLPGNQMALRIKHVGEYGDHAVAKRAGFQKGDILVSFDGQTGRMSESELLRHATQQKRPGDEVNVILLRNGERKSLKLVLQ